MTFGSYDTPKPKPVPTFLQYLKSCPKSVEGKTKFGVEIVWLPGNFDNVTLQTHAFRYITNSEHPLYSEIREYFNVVVSGDSYSRLDIVIDSIGELKITVIESTRKKGSWKKLGENAFKFEEA